MLIPIFLLKITKTIFNFWNKSQNLDHFKNNSLYGINLIMDFYVSLLSEE